MRMQDLQEALRKQPFEPFRIQLSNGQSHSVRHPESAGLTRSSVFVGLTSDDDEVPDRMVQCDLLQVVAVEPINGKQAGT